MSYAVETLKVRLEQLRNSVENEQRHHEQSLYEARASLDAQQRMLAQAAELEKALRKLET